MLRLSRRPEPSGYGTLRTHHRDRGIAHEAETISVAVIVWLPVIAGMTPSVSAGREGVIGRHAHQRIAAAEVRRYGVVKPAGRQLAMSVVRVGNLGLS
jgi:hypothetical protein